MIVQLIVELKNSFAMTTAYLIFESDVKNSRFVLLIFFVAFRISVLLINFISVIFKLFLFLLKVFCKFLIEVIFVFLINHINASLFIAIVVTFVVFLLIILRLIWCFSRIERVEVFGNDLQKLFCEWQDSWNKLILILLEIKRLTILLLIILINRIFELIKNIILRSWSILLRRRIVIDRLLKKAILSFSILFIRHLMISVNHIHIVNIISIIKSSESHFHSDNDFWIQWIEKELQCDVHDWFRYLHLKFQI